jgi:hypothetical protein
MAALGKIQMAILWTIISSFLVVAATSVALFIILYIFCVAMVWWQFATGRAVPPGHSR